MTRFLAACAAALLVAGCAGSTGKDNPFQEDPAEQPDDQSGGDPNPVDGDRALPPGTANPTPNNRITRLEGNDGQGGGFARNITYNNDQGQDEFFVDNIAFDGDNTYGRGTAVSNLGGSGAIGAFAVYESDAFTVDPLTQTRIGTLPYRAIYGRSTSGNTEFAIVRTGGFRNYGFGGFVYQRNDRGFNGDTAAVVLPDEGDATYSGAYAGMRVFKDRTGLEYVSGDAQVTIDFKDFNDNARGVSTTITNRRLFDINGNDITADYLQALDAKKNGATLNSNNGNLPDILPSVSPDIADGNGEITGKVFSKARFDDNTSLDLEEGNYYAIVSGQNAEEIVGIVVVESEDPRENVGTAQETGGFIVYRQ